MDTDIERLGSQVKTFEFFPLATESYQEFKMDNMKTGL